MRQIVGVVSLAGLCLSTAANGQTSGSPAPPEQLSDMVAAPTPPPYPPLPMLGATKAAAPANNPATWVSVNDYPKAALKEQRQGTTSFRVTVGVDGRPRACDLVASSGSPDLDAAACGLVMRRALFTPAKDVKGKPIEGRYSSRIRWVLPKSEPLEVKPESLVRSFTIEADGTATNCTEYKDGKLKEVPTMRTPCDTASKFKPLLDGNGAPTRKRVTIRQSVEVSDAP